MDKELEKEKLKTIELDILKEFINVCDKLELRYYLGGGTLLGAVRHKGFIPWDDDIDVIMPRPDYDKFMEKAQELLPTYLFVQNYHTDPKFPRMYTKLRNSNTTFIEYGYQCTNINHGIYIDIFPLEGVPTDKKQMINHLNKCNKVIGKLMYFNNINNTEIDYFYHKNPIIRMLKKTKKAVYKTFVVSDKKIDNKRKQLEGLLKKYDFDSSEFVGDILGRWGLKEIMPNKIYGKGVKLQFENLEANVPEDFDAHLKSLYNDYMTLPPEDKRESGHDVKIVDCDNSYTKYISFDK